MHDSNASLQGSKQSESNDFLALSSVAAPLDLDAIPFEVSRRTISALPPLTD
jgi:hypothetical protein